MLSQCESCSSTKRVGLLTACRLRPPSRRVPVTDQSVVDFGVAVDAWRAGCPVDVLVNNAFRPYIFDPELRKMHWQLDWSDYQSQIDGSVKAAQSLAQAVLPSMLTHAKGSIINIATNLVARPSVPYHDCTTAKAALIGYARNLAMELGPLGVRVNIVAPGLVYPTDASRTQKKP